MKTSELLPRCVSLSICFACHSIQCEIRSSSPSSTLSSRFIASHCIRVCGCVFIFVSHCSTIAALHPICSVVVSIKRNGLTWHVLAWCSSWVLAGRFWYFSPMACPICYFITVRVRLWLLLHMESRNKIFITSAYNISVIICITLKSFLNRQRKVFVECCCGASRQRVTADERWWWWWWQRRHWWQHQQHICTTRILCVRFGSGL